LLHENNVLLELHHLATSAVGFHMETSPFNLLT